MTTVKIWFSVLSLICLTSCATLLVPRIGEMGRGQVAQATNHHVSMTLLPYKYTPTTLAFSAGGKLVRMGAPDENYPSLFSVLEREAPGQLGETNRYISLVSFGFQNSKDLSYLAVAKSMAAGDLFQDTNITRGQSLFFLEAFPLNPRLRFTKDDLQRFYAAVTQDLGMFTNLNTGIEELRQTTSRIPISSGAITTHFRQSAGANDLEYFLQSSTGENPSGYRLLFFERPGSIPGNISDLHRLRTFLENLISKL